MPVLTTERLRLRKMTEVDAPALVTIFGDPAVMRFLDGSPVTTEEEGRALIRWFGGHFEAKEAIRWGITIRGEDSVIGTCGFHRWDRAHRHVEIGYDLASNCWGRGYMTEAMRAVVAWCFGSLDVHRIEGDCTDGNLASERVMVKLGFRYEGTWRERCWEHGRFVDLTQFGLLRREWETAQLDGDESSRTTPSGASSRAGSPPATG